MRMMAEGGGGSTARWRRWGLTCLRARRFKIQATDTLRPDSFQSGQTGAAPPRLITWSSDLAYNRRVHITLQQRSMSG